LVLSLVSIARLFIDGMMQGLVIDHDGLD